MSDFTDMAMQLHAAAPPMPKNSNSRAAQAIAKLCSRGGNNRYDFLEVRIDILGQIAPDPTTVSRLLGSTATHPLLVRVNTCEQPDQYRISVQPVHPQDSTPDGGVYKGEL